MAADISDAMPETERALVASLVAARDSYYHALGNDYLEATMERARAISVCHHLTGRPVTDCEPPDCRGHLEVKDWVGTIESLRIDRSHLSVKIGNGVEVENWDSIEPNSELHASLVSMLPGQAIRFSGTFVESAADDCIKHFDWTRYGSMTKPKYIMRFLKVEPLR